MRKFLEKNRWVVMIAAIVVMACTTFPALWGVFQADAATAYGITLEESAMIFPMCTAFFGIVSIIGGRLQDKFPPNIVATIGALIMGTGVIMLSKFGEGTSPITIYLCFALPFGGGCGLISPALSATLMKWYADKRGFSMGFSAACASGILVLMTYVSKYLLTTWGIHKTFLVYGITFLVLSAIGTLFLINPTKEYIIEKSALAMANSTSSNKKSQSELVDFTPSEMLRTKQFYLLFFAAILATPAYMLIAPSIVTLGISRGLSENLAVSSVAIATGVSAIGKFIIPTLSDKIGRKKSAIIFTICTTVFSVILMKATGISLLIFYSAMVFTHSGWSTLISPFVIDLFGSANAGANFGIVSLQATIASFLSSFALSIFAPILGPAANHIIGIVGIALAVILISMIDMDTSKIKAKENN